MSLFLYVYRQDLFYSVHRHLDLFYACSMAVNGLFSLDVHRKAPRHKIHVWTGISSSLKNCMAALETGTTAVFNSPERQSNVDNLLGH